jgi:ubiquinone/menaquinone biosynthesis C-methylase UbiE
VSSAGSGASGERVQPADSSFLGVEEGYERWAASYDRTPNPLIAREERYLEPLIDGLAGKSVLDLACGTGRWLEKSLTKQVRLGVGLDRSEAMLCAARNKRSLQGKLIQADCLNLPLRTASFDFVICSFALGHIREFEKAIGELARVLKAEGEVLVSDLHPGAYERGWRTGFRDARSAAQIEAFPRSCEEIIETFQAAAMECLGCESLCLEEPERSIFVRANKLQVFREVSRVPTVLVCRFQRRGGNFREHT